MMMPTMVIPLMRSFVRNRTGSYSIAEAEGVTRGTKIIISLLEGQEHFAKKQTIESTHA